MIFTITITRTQLLLSFALIILLTTTAFAQTSEGPLSPAGAINSTACSRAFGSSLGLAPPTNILVSDDVYATASHCGSCDAQTNCLHANDFGFSIPAGATIEGILVEVERHGSFGSNIQDNEVMLVKAGSETGVNKLIAAAWPSADAYQSYGGAADLWGTTWTPAEVNDTSFGLMFSCIDYTGGAATTSFIDHIQVTVHYSPPLVIDEIKEDQKQIQVTFDQGKETMNLKTNVLQPNVLPITIFDLSGKSIKDFSLNLQTGPQTHFIDLSELSGGVYFWKSGDQRSYFVKF